MFYQASDTFTVLFLEPAFFNGDQSCLKKKIFLKLKTTIYNKFTIQNTLKYEFPRKKKRTNRKNKSYVYTDYICLINCMYNMYTLKIKLKNPSIDAYDAQITQMQCKN